jgi:hypothetical protein
MAKWKIIFVLAMCFSTAIFSAQAASQTRIAYQTANTKGSESSRFKKNVAENLDVHWSRVEYYKGLRNPAIAPQYRNALESETLSFSFVVKMADPRLLLGIALEPTIEKIKDSRGVVIDINQKTTQPNRQYRNVTLMRWLTTINLNHPERTRIPTEQYTPRMELDGSLRKRLGDKIGLLKGYYEGLMAESLEYIDVPFRPNENWVRLTEKVEIRVAEARNVPDAYYYNIEQYPEDAISAKRVLVGEQLPHRLVVGRQMIGRNDIIVSAGGSGMGIGGKGNGIGGAETIRYIIAVNPAHVIIPVELRDIPLSVPTHSTPPRYRDPNRLKRLMSRKSVPSQIRMAKRYVADKARSQTKQVPIAKEGKFFDVDWYSIGYKLGIYNPEVIKLKNCLNLSISCKARILEPELILGTCDEPVIERITDGSGRDVNILLGGARPDHMVYKNPGYRPSRTLTQPSALIKLEGKARSAMQLPLQRRHFPTREMEMKPVLITISLDPRLIEQSQKEIGCIEGYFHALIADSNKHVKVPFKASPRWVRLTSDLSIQVAKAWHDGFQYRYLINERSKAQIEPSFLHVYCPLPDGILVERRFTGPGVPSKLEDFPRPEQRLPARAGGYGSVGCNTWGVPGKIDTIDYRVAVGPTHYKIPFELEHIPLPHP